MSPFFLFRPLAKGLDLLNQIPGSTLVAGTIGLVVGLVIAALISIPLFSLGGWLSWGIPLIISFSLGSLGLWLGAHREEAIRHTLPAAAVGMPGRASSNGRILVDTSAIIDGRIADLSETGFVQGTLVIPGFVLDELRHIADSSDSLRRTRGRRGLEVLGKLRKDATVAVQILDIDVNGAEVDRALVTLAKSMKAPILTTDFNLKPCGRTPRHTGAQRQRAGQRLEAHGASRRRAYGEHHPGGKGSWPGGGVSWTTGPWWS